MKKEIFIAIGVIILILLVSTFTYQLGKTAALEMGEASPTGPTSVLEKSKVVQSQWASARGKVTAITGRTLTLSAEGDTLAVLIKDNAELITLVTGAKGVPEPKPIEFKDIKVGDEVTIQIDVIAEDHLEGGNVTVLPAPSQ